MHKVGGGYSIWRHEKPSMESDNFHRARWRAQNCHEEPWGFSRNSNLPRKIPWLSTTNHGIALNSMEVRNRVGSSVRSPGTSWRSVTSPNNLPHPKLPLIFNDNCPLCCFAHGSFSILRPRRSISETIVPALPPRRQVVADQGDNARSAPFRVIFLNSCIDVPVIILRPSVFYLVLFNGFLMYVRFFGRLLFIPAKEWASRLGTSPSEAWYRHTNCRTSRPSLAAPRSWPRTRPQTSCT